MQGREIGADRGSSIGLAEDARFAGSSVGILSDAHARGWEGPLSLEPHLRHSRAVMATGVGGRENQRFQSLSAEECFDVAARIARDLLAQIGAKVS